MKATQKASKPVDKVRKRTRAKPVEVAALVPISDSLPDPLSDIATPASRHRNRVAKVLSKRPTVTDANKARFIALMNVGEIPTDICDDATMPTMAAFITAIKTDEAFAEAYDQAYSVMADMALQDAWHFARDAASTGNIDAQRIADSYAKTLANILEKLSPKSYGVLVKHAGADGGNINVSVVSYADKPTAIGTP